MKTKCCCVVPARGGSRGIKRKNIRVIAGKPLVVYAIEQASQAPCIDRVIVSTDDDEIARVASESGAEVVKRPAELSTDEASSESALLHALEDLEKKENYVPDILVFVQCTSPLILAEDIEKTVQKLIQENADSAFTVAPSHAFLWKQTEQGEAVGINHDKRIRLRRQDMEKQYSEAGSVYVMKVEGFKNAQYRFFGKTVFHIIPEERALQIDNKYECDIAEVILRKRQMIDAYRIMPQAIEGIAFDFDGVFTDNKVYLTEEGNESVMCDRLDGLGVNLLKKSGIPLMVISSEKNKVVRERCEKLGIPCHTGIENKRVCLETWIKEHKLNKKNVVFLGNDVNDIDCLRFVGCGVVVNDAHDDAKGAAKIILSSIGGKGAVRELIDLILKKENHDA